MLFGAWRTQMEALPECEEIMSPPIAVWPQCMNVTDRRTADRQACGNTDSMAYSHESEKIDLG